MSRHIIVILISVVVLAISAKPVTPVIEHREVLSGVESTEKIETPIDPVVPQTLNQTASNNAGEQIKPAPQPEIKAPEKPAEFDKRRHAWDFFKSHGYTSEQTAGILGNLEREHRFNTTDVPGGLGIAQWLGGRREKLLAKPNPFDYQTQLEFIIEELNDKERTANGALKAATTVAHATKVFQDKYERCNPAKCNLIERTNYAQEFYNKWR